MLARAIGARRVFELGSGFGYSAYWFARATGAEGEIHLTDGDAANERKAADYLGRAGVSGPHAPTTSATRSRRSPAVEGDFDVVYDDIDKDGYPDAWRAARDRVRVGGLYICDNTLWYGRVPARRRGRPMRSPTRSASTTPRSRRTSGTWRRSCRSATACWSRLRIGLSATIAWRRWAGGRNGVDSAPSAGRPGWRRSPGREIA